jgi:metal-responsive CopG/Arc/MetJ family transcriptional regulator
MTKVKDYRITIRLDAAMMHEIDKLAHDELTNPSNLIRRAIKEYLTQYKK